MKALEQIPRINLRHRRAEVLAHHFFQIVGKYTRDDMDKHDLFNEILDLFHDTGAEVITDYDREQMGLPSRGPDGWTLEEIIAWDARRLDLLRRPIGTVFFPLADKPVTSDPKD